MVITNFHTHTHGRAEQKYSQTREFTYLGTTISDVSDLGVEIQSWIRLAWFSFRKYDRVLHDWMAGVFLGLEDPDA